MFHTLASKLATTKGYGGSEYARTSVLHPNEYESPPQNKHRSRYERRHFHDNIASFVSAKCCLDRTQHSFGPLSSQQSSQNSPIGQRVYFTPTHKREECAGYNPWLHQRAYIPPNGHTPPRRSLRNMEHFKAVPHINSDVYASFPGGRSRHYIDTRQCTYSKQDCNMSKNGNDFLEMCRQTLKNIFELLII